MGIKWKTKINKLPELTENTKTINGRKVKVGAMRGENARLAGIHEYGCQIRAKHSQYLTIPINPKAKGKKASEFNDLFFIESTTGEKFLARDKKVKGENQVELLFWLTKSVNIPERSFLRTGHDENGARIIEQTERALSQLINGKMSVDDLLDTYGEQMAAAVKKRIRDISSPPDSSVTMEVKGSNNPLMDTHGLLESIVWKKE